MMDIEAQVFMNTLDIAKGLLCAFYGRIPHRTKEQALNRNMGILIELRDEFLNHLTNHEYEKMFSVIWDIGILKYGEDAVYQRAADHVLSKWLEYTRKAKESDNWQFPVKKIEHPFWRYDV